MSNQKNWWKDEMPIETAKLVLGEQFFNATIALGKAHCKTRATGAWYANEPESYGAYLTAERIAK